MIEEILSNEEVVRLATQDGCREMQEICPYYSRCRREKKKVRITYSEIGSPKDTEYFALGIITPESRIWSMTEEGRQRLISCSPYYSNCFYDILEKRRTNELRSKIFQVMKDIFENGERK